jgi:hypothetical protein
MAMCRQQPRHMEINWSTHFAIKMFTPKRCPSCVRPEPVIRECGHAQEAWKPPVSMRWEHSAPPIYENDICDLTTRYNTASDYTKQTDKQKKQDRLSKWEHIKIQYVRSSIASNNQSFNGSLTSLCSRPHQRDILHVIPEQLWTLSILCWRVQCHRRYQESSTLLCC